MPGLNLSTPIPMEEFKPAPADVHLGICVQVVDLGTHATKFVNPKTGAAITKHEVRLGFELPYAKMDDGRPFLVAQKWTASLHSKSNFRKVLENWRGRTFSTNEVESFDLKNLLGVPAMVNVVHTPKQDGSGVWVNILSLSRLGRNPETGEAIKTPTPTNPLVFLELTKERFDPKVFDALGEGTQKFILKTPEWAELQGQGKPPTFQAPTNHPSTPWPDDNDSIPF